MEKTNQVAVNGVAAGVEAKLIQDFQDVESGLSKLQNIVNSVALGGEFGTDFLAQVGEIFDYPDLTHILASIDSIQSHTLEFISDFRKDPSDGDGLNQIVDIYDQIATYFIVAKKKFSSGLEEYSRIMAEQPKKYDYATIDANFQILGAVLSSLRRILETNNGTVTIPRLGNDPESSLSFGKQLEILVQDHHTIAENALKYSEQSKSIAGYTRDLNQQSENLPSFVSDENFDSVVSGISALTKLLKEAKPARQRYSTSTSFSPEMLEKKPDNPLNTYTSVRDKFETALSELSTICQRGLNPISHSIRVAEDKLTQVYDLACDHVRNKAHKLLGKEYQIKTPKELGEGYRLAKQVLDAVNGFQEAAQYLGYKTRVINQDQIASIESLCTAISEVQQGINSAQERFDSKVRRLEEKIESAREEVKGQADEYFFENYQIFCMKFL